MTPTETAALPNPAALPAKHPISDAEIERLAPSRGERLFLVLSIFIGVLSGLLVVCFRISIEWLGVIFLGSAPHPHQLRLFFAPAGTGLIVAALVKWVFPQARGSGVNQTKAALYIYNGYISFRTMLGKFITAALAIGSGHSLGPEDPSLQIGAGIASVVARRLRLSRERLRVFAPVGAAAGLAAAFNAPISAILFVIEEVIGRWSAAVLGSIVLSAVSSVVVARWFWGAEPIFRIPTLEIRDTRELLAYAFLGFIGGIAALVFSKSLAFLRPRLRQLPDWTHLLQPAIAGLLVGGIGYFGFPQVMGPGYQVIDQAMHGQYIWQVLLALAVLKIIATTISFSSGTPGGMFAPTLFIGAMLGAAVGSFEKFFFPGLTGSVGAYALVGMGVLFAGFLRAPLTSVFMVLEVSGNYSIVLPVILANTIAYLLSRALQPHPIFEVFTHQDGLDLPSMEERREETSLQIEDALAPPNALVLSGADSVSVICAAITGQKAPYALVRCAHHRWYVLTADEAAKLAPPQPDSESAGSPSSQSLDAPSTDSATPSSETSQCAPQSSTVSLESLLPPERAPVLYPDLPLDVTLPYFRRWPVLPVANRAVMSLLEGVLTQDAVLACYQNHIH